MDPIFLLKELSILKELETALDVGARDGKIASRLAEMGLTVDAIDTNDLLVPTNNFQFEKISVADFIEKNTKKYDLVVARHILHLLPNPKEVLIELKEMSDILFFTCFGPKDDWFGKVSTLSQEDVLELFQNNKILHKSETFQYGKTYAGDTKFWHINTFVIKN